MKGVKIDIKMEDFDGDIMGDESQLKQIILNMSKNSIEAMSDINDPKLQIKTRLNQAGNEAMLIIGDNGKGIPKDKINMLGRPFFTTKKNGTGLGLSSCFRIIKEHNGKIEIDSEENKGTTFTISFPLYSESV